MDAIIYKDTIYGGGGAMRGNYFNPIIYSTEEREVGVWKDNKPLYAKVFDFGETVQLRTSGTNIASYLPSDIDMITDAVLFNIEYRYEYHVLLQHYNNNQVIAYPDQNLEGRFIYVQYTKTTDVAGSGKYNTLGVPNVHYTTDEQVIGTWMGETLYQNFIDLGSATIISPNGVQINIGSIDVKQPVNAFGIYDLVIEEAKTLPLLWYKYNGNMYFSSSTTAGCNKLILQYTKTTD